MDIDWDLLAHYLAGLCRGEERARFEQWLAEAPEHKAVLQGARRVVVGARREVSAARAAELLASFRSTASAVESSGAWPPTLRVMESDRSSAVVFPLSVRRNKWTARLKIAAAIFLLAGGAAVWRALPQGKSTHGETSTSFHEVVTTRGQRIAFQLSDGSAVLLAPESRLRIPREYGARDRSIFLVGQGAFTVAHDATRPFAVHTTHGVVKDLGTRFVVREYENDPAVEVVVAEGEVELQGRAGGGGQRALLTPGQLGRVEQPHGNITVRSRVDLNDYTAWTKGRLVFRDMPLREAAQQIGRWYDVEVRLASEAIGHRHLTASAQDELVGNVIQMVAATLDLDLTISSSGHIYTLRAR